MCPSLVSFFFQLPEDFEVMFDEAAGELIIGGIYLRLFIQQPAWVSSEFVLLVDFHYELQALQALLFVPELRS